MTLAPAVRGPDLWVQCTVEHLKKESREHNLWLPWKSWKVGLWFRVTQWGIIREASDSAYFLWAVVSHINHRRPSTLPTPYSHLGYQRGEPQDRGEFYFEKQWKLKEERFWDLDIADEKRNTNKGAGSPLSSWLHLRSFLLWNALEFPIKVSPSIP